MTRLSSLQPRLGQGKVHPSWAMSKGTGKDELIVTLSKGYIGHTYKTDSLAPAPDMMVNVLCFPGKGGEEEWYLWDI
jgi:hypothetical protein